MTVELEAQNLKVVFDAGRGEFAAVNDVSFCLEKGETLAIVGESGCGKTVTALSILRLIPEPPGRIVGGKILFDSCDILGLDMGRLRAMRGKDIGMVFQDPMTSLNPVLTVGGQIIETLLRHTPLSRREARRKAEDLLWRVEIPSPGEKLDAYPHQLSGGMRQRVMIAMALSCNPRILIADEPTTALDALIQAQILELLENLKSAGGLSILLITHDLGVVAETAQRVLVMYAGEIVESGPVEQLLRSPLHPYTVGLLNSLPKPPVAGEKRRRLEEIPGTVPSMFSLPSGCPFHPRCPSVMERCRAEKPSLETVWIGHAASCWLHRL